MFSNTSSYPDATKLRRSKYSPKGFSHKVNSHFAAVWADVCVLLAHRTVGQRSNPAVSADVSCSTDSQQNRPYLGHELCTALPPTAAHSCGATRWQHCNLAAADHSLTLTSSSSFWSITYDFFSFIPNPTSSTAVSTTSSTRSLPYTKLSTQPVNTVNLPHNLSRLIIQGWASIAQSL